MTAPTRHLLARAATAAATIGLLAGCTGGTTSADPTPTAVATSAQPSPTPSTSPTAVATAPPWAAAMDEVTVDGAQAVAEYFLRLFPYVVETGDTTEWDHLSHPECLYCADLSRYARDDASLSSAPEVEVTAQSTQEVDPGVLFMVTLHYAETFDDGTRKEFSGLVAVVREGEQWLIRGVQLDPIAP